VGVNALDIGLIHHGELIPRRARLDLVARHIELNAMLAPVDLLHGMGRHQDVLCWPQVPGVDNKVSDAPTGVVDDEILEMADLAIGGVNTIARDFGDAPQIGIAVMRRARTPTS
jgi:hypothetical protein